MKIEPKNSIVVQQLQCWFQFLTSCLHTICHVTLLTLRKWGLFLHPLMLDLPSDLLWAQNEANMMACWFSAYISKSPVSSCLFLNLHHPFQNKRYMRSRASLSYLQSRGWSRSAMSQFTSTLVRATTGSQPSIPEV